MSEPTIVCVLGMHRSGTSLVARVLNLLGLDLGPEEHLMRPGPANPTGHWESRPISRLNDEILERLGGSWSDPPGLAAGWERRPELAEARRKARQLIAVDFAGSDLWGFKDPRNSLTAPFWQRLLPPMRYVICLRNPVDVAASLEAREDEPVPVEQGIGLWLTYVRAAIAATAGHRRELVFYEDLMADPGPVVNRLARFIGADQSGGVESETRAAIDVAVSQSLWHHRTPVPDVVDTAALAFHVKAVYLALRLFVPGEQRVGAEVLDLFGAYAADAGRRLAELDVSRAELEKVRQRSEALDRERAEEEELRRRLEDELEAKRAELDRGRQARARDSAPAAGHPPAIGSSPSGPDDPLVPEIRAMAQEVIPSGATVLVAGKGDDALLRLEGRRGWHFPMAADGRYAGYHPAGDTAVLAHLEALRARGADHLLLPATSLWWLDHYHGLRRHLEDRYVQLLEDERCAVFRLRPEERRHAGGAIAAIKRAVASLRIRTGRNPSILDWGTDLGIADQLPEMLVFSPPSEQAVLPYLDGTIDVVVAGAGAAQIEEARRVAAHAVIRVDPSSQHPGELEWLAGDDGGWGEDVNVTLIPDADAAYWDATISALAETLDDGFAGQLSVVDDPAKLERASERAAVAGVRVRPIEVRAGVTLAQRAGTAIDASDGRIHVFVAAPAVALPDCLPSILALLRSNRDAGAVGTRILSPEGTLEEAGGILEDGMPRRRGEGDHDPDRPEYRFVRQVDFCSPPLLATRRDLFERLGGFDERPATPAEAMVDFSLRAGQSGAPVYYQPQARVVKIAEDGR